MAIQRVIWRATRPPTPRLGLPGSPEKQKAQRLGFPVLPRSKEPKGWVSSFSREPKSPGVGFPGSPENQKAQRLGFLVRNSIGKPNDLVFWLIDEPKNPNARGGLARPSMQRLDVRHQRIELLFAHTDSRHDRAVPTDDVGAWLKHGAA